MPLRLPKHFTEHLFRKAYGEVFSLLFRQFGPEQQNNLEDALQEAFLTALKVWPQTGAPEKPKAWLLQVARNKLLTALKRTALSRETLRKLEAELSVSPSSGPQPQDSQLQLLFALCHPGLSSAAQIIFALRYLGGFGVPEIAQGLQQNKEAVYKSLQRSKKFFGSLPPDFMEASIQHSPERLQQVLKTIYLLFYEGYDTTTGEQLLNQDFCLEPIRLAHLLEAPFGKTHPEVYHLLALLYFHFSRFEARTGLSGSFVPLPAQNRFLWDKKLIALGFRYLHRSFPERGNAYYTQACIAGLHAAAPAYAQTDWPAILRLYNVLSGQDPSFIVKINRAIALAECEGPAQGINALLSLSETAKHYYLYHVALGDLYARHHQPAHAKACYQTALQLTTSDRRKEIIWHKQEQLIPG